MEFEHDVGRRGEEGFNLVLGKMGRYGDGFDPKGG